MNIEAILKRLGVRGPSIEDLAAVWPVQVDRLERALADGGLEVDGRQALEVHVRIGEELDLDASRHADAQAHPVVLDTMTDAALRPEPGLHVSPELAERLPLLDLATDVAAREPSRRLTIEECPTSEMGADGYFTRSSRAAIILLADHLEENARLAEVFGHELGHALDASIGSVHPVGQEAFADELGPMLLEAQPASISDATPLIARALEATHHLRQHCPPLNSAEALILWALEDAGVIDPAPELLAACSRVRGFNQ